VTPLATNSFKPKGGAMKPMAAPNRKMTLK